MEGNQQIDRQTCEVYSRVVGYIRPVEQWNPGKQSEFADRRMFAVSDQKSITPPRDQ
jgi:ribonucleoside-triphosphate reductase (formate)